MSGGTILERGLRFVRTMVMAKLFLREELGIVALCLAILFMFESFGEVGIRISVIQNKIGDKEEYLNASWWMQSVRGLILGVIGIFFSGMIAGFYDEPRLANYLRIVFFTLIFNGLISPKTHLLEKQLRFGKYLFVYQGSMLFGTLLTIVLAFLYRNVWAVIIGYTSESLFRFIISFLLCPFFPRFPIDRESFRELLSFAKGMVGLPLLTLVAYQADIFFLGKMVPKEQLGMYSMALQIARLPRDLINQVMSKILLPVFSLQQDEIPSLRSNLLQVTRWTALGLAPLTGFFITCSGPLLFVVLKPEYVEAMLPFILLCLVSFLRIQAVIISSMYFAMNQLNQHRFFTALRVVVLLICMVPFIEKWGITGAALAVLAGEFSGFAFQMWMLKKKLSLLTELYVRSFEPGFRITAILIACTCGWLYLFSPSFHPYAVEIQLAGGLVLLGGVFLLAGFLNYREIKQIIYSRKKEDES